MLSYASAYKMCVPTLSKLLNATARSRRAGPRACRLPDQLAWETLPGSAREGVSSYTTAGKDSQMGSKLLTAVEDVWRRSGGTGDFVYLFAELEKFLELTRTAQGPM